MRRMLSFFILVLGLGLMATAGFLFWENQQVEQTALQTSQQVTRSLTAQLEAAVTATAQVTDLTLSPQDTALTPTIQVDGTPYLGLLSIPSLDLTLPVASDWSYSQLKSTPCIYQGSLTQNNLVIMAHNYDAHFGDLNQLQLGDGVTLLDSTGTTHSYTVTEIATLAETDIDALSQGDWDLTLFTCLYGNNSYRTVVRLVSTTS